MAADRSVSAARRCTMDLTTNYLGWHLKNPLVAGASPLSGDLDTVRALEDAGIAAVVLYSVFQEQIEHEAALHDHYEEFGTHSYPEALTYAPRFEAFPRGPQEYAGYVARLKAAVDVPIIASLNG